MTQPVLITLERLRELLSYDAETGVFTWSGHSGSAKAGDIAGTQCDGYTKIQIEGRLYRGHRLAWFYVTGKWPEKHLDHRDGVRSNNRWANLRPASPAENHQNRSVQKNNKSGFLGVNWHRGEGKWRASIQSRGRRTYLGYFATAEAAHEAYLKAKADLHEFQPAPRAG